MDTRRIATAGVCTAMIAMLTYFPHVPTPVGGYIHLGDSLIYTIAILYGGVFGGAVAGIGSAIADLLAAPIFALPTLIIKGIMGFIAGRIGDKTKAVCIRNIFAMLISGLFMVLGYFYYEYMLFGSIETALLGTYMTLIQYGVGVVLGNLILYIVKKSGILKR